MKKRNLIIHRLVDLINQQAPNAELYLYGSQARRSARKNSDWDLLILLNTNQLSFDQETLLIDSLYEVELETGEIISPLIYTKQEWLNHHQHTPLYLNISKEGVRLK